MKVCILSDSHDNRFLLAAAARAAQAQGAEAILHCGDVVAPTTLRSLIPMGLPVHVIHGNNTGDLYNMAQLAHDTHNLLHYHGQDAGIELATRKIFMVHYPHYAEAMATTGDWDIVCCGHDHRSKIAHIDNIKGSQTLLLNPGTVGGVGAKPTYILGDLQTLSFSVELVPIEDNLVVNRQPVTPHQ